MQDSYCEIQLPFASSPEFLENYTNASGGIRTGLLMEHLDSLAGSIAYKHMLGPDVSKLPKDAGFYIVTASVDRQVTHVPIRYSAHACYHQIGHVDFFVSSPRHAA